MDRATNAISTSRSDTFLELLRGDLPGQGSGSESIVFLASVVGGALRDLARRHGFLAVATRCVGLDLRTMLGLTGERAALPSAFLVVRVQEVKECVPIVGPMELDEPVGRVSRVMKLVRALRDELMLLV